ncbi:hypothetical protein [Altererythrobacter sp.]|uniref:hypothetical protein n=1 Tax=Altererythrobacter sp. TaxID=1872480 RepID=UPI003CFC6B37
MKALIAIVGLAALAACSQAEAPPAEEEVATEAEAPVGPQPGTYEVTNEDGSYTITINEGNTWVVPGEDGEDMTGTFEMVDGKACFSTDGSDEPPSCSTGSEPDENGVVTITNDDGTTATVKEIETDSGAEAAAE